MAKFDAIIDPSFDLNSTRSNTTSRCLCQAQKISQALTVLLEFVVTEPITSERLQAAEIMAELAVGFNALMQTIEYKRQAAISPVHRETALAKPRKPNGSFKAARKPKPPGNTISDLIPLK